jgi:Sec-independent protein translocase protein TatA
MPKVIKQDEISQNYWQGPYFCTMMKFIIYGMLIYFLYKLIFQVVVPVSKGVRSVRKNMEQMQKQQAEAIRNAQNSHKSSQNTSANYAPKEEPVEAEYIEFEEVKKK